ncbi:hypothetical protein E2C01_000824 [Portunus trituberculatus]|uniref:Uncharacterized protein n=1 Tax=Portunus trituberculatus TaxID=210409 RepID=A0A5B7CIN4_PORTR|nr:hypothetical protein [Portunus trituberculatus]
MQLPHDRHTNLPRPLISHDSSHDYDYHNHSYHDLDYNHNHNNKKNHCHESHHDHHNYDNDQDGKEEVQDVMRRLCVPFMSRIRSIPAILSRPRHRH